jgi:hypothetical protein
MERPLAMTRHALAAALVAAALCGEAEAQRLTVDSTYDPHSRISRVVIASTPLATGVSSLDAYALAEVVIAPGSDSYLRYTTSCRVWAVLHQERPGQYWENPAAPVELLVRKRAVDPAAPVRSVASMVSSAPGRDRGGDLKVRLPRDRREAAGITAQVHAGPGRVFLVEFPPEFFEAVAEVTARADNALLKASRANGTREICR